MGPSRPHPPGILRLQCRHPSGPRFRCGPGWLCFGHVLPRPSAESDLYLLRRRAWYTPRQGAVALLSRILPCLSGHRPQCFGIGLLYGPGEPLHPEVPAPQSKASTNWAVPYRSPPLSEDGNTLIYTHRIGPGYRGADLDQGGAGEPADQAVLGHCKETAAERCCCTSPPLF